MRDYTVKRVVLMVIDGLRADSVRPDWMPGLHGIATRSCWFSAHRGVFPSATRVSSASIATGCYPARHGLAGNAIAWDEGDGLKAISAGPVGFRDRWWRVTGHTLLVPTMAERVAGTGGMVIHSNSSPGAAHMQDPHGHALFFHRSGCWSPGFASAPGTLEVDYDSTGDAITTVRFCDYLLHDGPCAINLLWICEPDHTQHVIELGSPEHRAILAGSDRLAVQVADTVARLRERGEEVLFMVASDHGQETCEQVIDVDAALVAAGLKANMGSTDVVVASSGMGALIYLAREARHRDQDIALWLRAQPWCRAAWYGDELAAVGQRPAGGLAAAFAMAGRGDANRFGVPGFAYVVKDPFSPKDSSGLGQHGGMGPYEGAALLLADGPGFIPAKDGRATSLVHIAPTALKHLGLPAPDMDGYALQAALG
ncbi:MAG: hypothetical protein GKR94_30090 [Gammaproteobacteria bacterium]|nr:hypothetical protein [Gammaproteobacteria bacterium]